MTWHKRECIVWRVIFCLLILAVVESFSAQGLTEHTPTICPTGFTGEAHNLTECVAGDVKLQAGQSSGDYITGDIDNTDAAWWGHLDFVKVGAVSVQIQLCVDGTCDTESYIGPDGTTSTKFTSASDVSFAVIQASKAPKVRLKYYLTDSDAIYYLTFDGSNEYVRIPTASNLNLSSAVSISLWFNAVNTTGTQVLADRSPSSANGWQITYTNAGDATTYCYIGTGSWAAATQAAASTGNWHHLVCTWDASTGIKLYVDNAAPATASKTGSMGTGSIDMVYGASGRTLGASPFNGSIDNVCIWNTVISSTNVSTLYNSGTGANCSGVGSGLVSAWPTDDGSGTTSTDGVDGNNGTLTNMEAGDWVPGGKNPSAVSASFQSMQLDARTTIKVGSFFSSLAGVATDSIGPVGSNKVIFDGRSYWVYDSDGVSAAKIHGSEDLVSWTLRRTMGQVGYDQSHSLSYAKAWDNRNIYALQSAQVERFYINTDSNGDIALAYIDSTGAVDICGTGNSMKKGDVQASYQNFIIAGACDSGGMKAGRSSAEDPASLPTASELDPSIDWNTAFADANLIHDVSVSAGEGTPTVLFYDGDGASYRNLQWTYWNSTWQNAVLVKAGTDINQAVLLVNWQTGEVYALYRIGAAVYMKIKTTGLPGTWGSEKTMVSSGVAWFDATIIETGGGSDMGDIVIYWRDSTTGNMKRSVWDYNLDTVSAATIELKEGTFNFNIEQWSTDVAFGALLDSTNDRYLPFVDTFTKVKINSALEVASLVHHRTNYESTSVAVQRSPQRIAILYFDRDGKVNVRAYDTQWGSAYNVGRMKGANWSITTPRAGVDSNWKMYVSWNGDDSPSGYTSYLEAKKSCDALNAGTFDVTCWNAFTLWSSTAQPTSWTILNDESGNVYFVNLEGSSLILRKYDGASWTNVTLVTGVNSVIRPANGDEGSSRSIHLGWLSGSTLHHLKVVPGSPTTASCANGNSVTLPATSSSCATVDPDIASAAWQGNVDVDVDARPQMIHIKTPATNYARHCGWTGSAWACTQLGEGTAPGLWADKDTDFVVTVYNGPNSSPGIKMRESLDNGVTFAAETEIIDSFVEISYPIVHTTTGTASAGDLTWGERTTQLDMELYWRALLPTKYQKRNRPFNHPWNRLFGLLWMSEDK